VEGREKGKGGGGEGVPPLTILRSFATILPLSILSSQSFSVPHNGVQGGLPFFFSVPCPASISLRPLSLSLLFCLSEFPLSLPPHLPLPPSP
jgi:hypothetical protein